MGIRKPLQANIILINSTTLKAYYEMILDYVVQATNGTINSSISDCVDVWVIHTVPSSPILSAISPNPDLDGYIHLTWNYMGDILEYHIFRDISEIFSIDSRIPLDSIPGTQSEYYDLVSIEDQYYYIIIAENLYGNSSISNCVDVVISFSVPLSPTLHPILPNPNTNGSIELSWDPANDVVFYHIFREESQISSPSGLVPKHTISGDLTTYRDIVSVNGTYFYALIAENLQGNSSISYNQSIEVGIIPIITYDMYVDTGYIWMLNSSIQTINLGNDEYYYINLPFEFEYFSHIFTSVYISSNGFLRFEEEHISYLEDIFPSNEIGSNYIIAPYLTDLNPQEKGHGGYICHYECSDFVIFSWIDIYRNLDTQPTGSFQVILYSNGKIKFQYDYMQSLYTNYLTGLNYGNGLFGNNYTMINNTVDNFAIEFYPKKNINNIAPNITHNPDLELEFSNSDYTLYWTPIDDASLKFQSYQIYFDHIIQNNDPINSPDYWIPYNPIYYEIPDSLPEGNYNITIYLFDGLGGNVSDEIYLTISNWDPRISSPIDKSLLLGETYNISWSILDYSYPIGTYIIYLNETEIKNGLWMNENSIINYSVQQEISGLYNYRIRIYDYLNLYCEDRVNITILPNHLPEIIIEKSSLTFTVNETILLQWRIFDIDYNRSRSIYRMYINDTEIESGIWPQELLILINLKNIEIGSYSIRLYINDGYIGDTEKEITLNIVDLDDDDNNSNTDKEKSDVQYITFGIISAISIVVIISIVKVKRKLIIK